MDERIRGIVTRQRSAGFSGLSGTDVRAAIRVSTPLLNEAIAAYLPSPPAVRELTVTPRAGNRFDVDVKLAKALVPPITVTVAIARQPQFPSDPTLVLQLTGVGSLVRFAAPALGPVAAWLPPGVRLEGDRVTIDLRTLLHVHGQSQLLDYIQDLAVGTEEGRLLVLVDSRVP